MTKEKFESYDAIREGGLTNMFDVNMVIRLSNFTLTKEDCLDIMDNYAKYEKEFASE